MSDKIFHMSGNLIFIRLRADTTLDSCGDASTLIRVMKIAFLLAQAKTSSAINKTRRRSCQLPAQKSPPGNCKIEKLLICKREWPHKFPNYNFRFSFMLRALLLSSTSACKLNGNFLKSSRKKACKKEIEILRKKTLWTHRSENFQFPFASSSSSTWIFIIAQFTFMKI